jgi:hypothetical protein
MLKLHWEKWYSVHSKTGCASATGNTARIEKPSIRGSVPALMCTALNRKPPLSGKPVRAVASANGANAISIIVPCRRIVGSRGDLTGYAGGVDIKNQLLLLESKDKPI